MIEHSPTIAAIAAAMHSVQGAVSGVAKDSKNPHFKNTYASLEAVVEAIRQPCQDAGLVVIQAPGEIANGCVSVTTMLAHAKSGEWIRTTAQLPMAKIDPQGAGSALTYAERYSLMAMFNLPPVDDDAEGATSRTQAPASTTEQRIADDIRRRVAVAKTEADLSKITSDPDTVRAFKSLPPILQEAVGKAISDRRLQLVDTTAAG